MQIEELEYDDRRISIVAPIVAPHTITNDDDSRLSAKIPSFMQYHANMSKIPQLIICPECKQEGTTLISREVGAATIMVGYLLFLLTTIFCFWIPCCIDDCQDIIHRCPNCKSEVGITPFQIL